MTEENVRQKIEKSLKDHPDPYVRRFLDNIDAAAKKKLDEEAEKRKIIEEGDSSDPLRNFDTMTKDWVKRFLNLSGVIRNEYSQITDIYKRPSERQIRGMMKELFNIQISERRIRQYKRYLIKIGELKSDEEFKLEQPTRETLREIKKTGARATAIARSKEKLTLTPSEKEFYLGKEKVEETKESKLKKLREDIEEHGYCPNAEEEKELEEREEDHPSED